MNKVHVDNYNGNIDKKLKGIIQNLLKLDFESTYADFLDEHLLSNRFKLAPRDLVYLHRDVEKAFDITIPQIDIAEGRFSSFNSICALILSQLDQRNYKSEKNIS